MLIVAQLAPAADVSVSQDAGVLLDNSLDRPHFAAGRLSDVPGHLRRFLSEDETDAPNPRASGSTIAWHTDAFVPNEMAVLYNADQGTVACMSMASTWITSRRHRRQPHHRADDLIER